MRKTLESTVGDTVKIIFDRAEGSTQFDVSIAPCDGKSIPAEIATLLVMMLDNPAPDLAPNYELIAQIARSGMRRQFDVSEFTNIQTSRLHNLDYNFRNSGFLTAIHIQPESEIGRLADAIGKQIAHNIRAIQTPAEFSNGMARMMSAMFQQPRRTQGSTAPRAGIAIKSNTSTNFDTYAN